ncbi:MAG: hypothetical protein QOF70_1091 [Acetobacteraceae bacterium]|jgi:hypothetical protein|nr:hypothetical protein [Acetobacteraceae bacterium]
MPILYGLGAVDEDDAGACCLSGRHLQSNLELQSAPQRPAQAIYKQVLRDAILDGKTARPTIGIAIVELLGSNPGTVNLSPMEYRMARWV